MLQITLKKTEIMADLKGPEVIRLGRNIIEAQQKEIEQMKQKIKEPESR